MKIAIMASPFAKRYMNVNSCQVISDLMNIFNQNIRRKAE